MLILKRLMVFGILFILGSTVVMGQTGARPGGLGGRDEMTVEQSYLQESVELMIIREQARAESRDMKLVALEYIGDAIGRGNRGPEILTTLEFLSLEGIVNRTMENGRLVNNFPDVRMRAATHLGQMGTREAHEVLIRLAMADNEPMVIAEAIKSLATIGINDNNVTTDTISSIVNRFNILNPDNLLALSALEAFERIAAVNGFISPNAITTIIRIAEGNYIRPVQERARALLFDMMNR